MKALFNGACNRCRTFRPRCATVRYRGDAEIKTHGPGWVTLCDDCRKLEVGKYYVHEKHRTH